MANMGPIQTRGQITDVKQVMNYVYQLEEQIRYALKHLDSGNIQTGSIGAEQLSSAVLEKVNNTERARQADNARSASRTKNDAAQLDSDGYRQKKGTFQARADEESFLSLGGEAETPAAMIRGDGTAALLALTLSGLRAPGVRVEGAATEEEEEARLYEIVISENKPLGHGVIWLRAGAETTNGRPCDVYYIP